jgi:hypothetical protein
LPGLPRHRIKRHPERDGVVRVDSSPRDMSVRKAQIAAISKLGDGTVRSAREGTEQKPCVRILVARKSSRPSLADPNRCPATIAATYPASIAMLGRQAAAAVLVQPSLKLLERRRGACCPASGEVVAYSNCASMASPFSDRKLQVSLRASRATERGP